MEFMIYFITPECIAIKEKMFHILTVICLYTAKYINTRCILRGTLNKFPDFFRMGTFIDSTHMKL